MFLKPRSKSRPIFIEPAHFDNIYFNSRNCVTVPFSLKHFSGRECEDEGGGVYVAECIALILEYPYITFTRQYLTQVSRLFLGDCSWHVGSGISIPF